jgi:choline dehydrogenase-like flavoprotein
MGLTPSSSVINQDFESHEVANLFVVDSSVFVTSSSVNPANTIQALALMAADKIASRMNNLKVR